MNVYIVEVDDNELNRVDAVFSSREKAVKYVMDTYSKSFDLDTIVTQKPTRSSALFKFTWDSEDNGITDYTIYIERMTVNKECPALVKFIKGNAHSA